MFFSGEHFNVNNAIILSVPVGKHSVYLFISQKIQTVISLPVVQNIPQLWFAIGKRNMELLFHVYDDPISYKS